MPRMFGINTARDSGIAIALFLAGPDQTFPVYLYSQLRFASRLPIMIALGVLLMAGTLTLLFAADRIRRLR